MKTGRFEELEVWKSARKITNRVFDFTDRITNPKDYGFCRQIRDASLSIMSNISEGAERDGDKEFTQFLSIAKGSAGEVRSQLFIALDRGFIDKAEFEELYGLLLFESRMLSSFMKYLKGSGYKKKRYSK